MDEPTKIFDKLWAVQIDPIKEMQRNYVIVQEYVASVLVAKAKLRKEKVPVE